MNVSTELVYVTDCVIECHYTVILPAAAAAVVAVTAPKSHLKTYKVEIFMCLVVAITTLQSC